MNNFVSTTFLYLCLHTFTSSSSYDAESENHQNHSIRPKVVLPEHYAKENRPPSVKGLPVVVDFNIYVIDINSINVEDMDFRLDMFIRQSWTESRLSIPSDIFEEGDDHVIFPPEFFDNLWQPDPYFLNSKISEIAALNHQFSSITLYRNKTVRYSARMHAIIACQMAFQLYPMDVQNCPLYIESFSYNQKKLSLKWGAEGVKINPELKLLQYDIGKPLQLEEITTFVDEKNGNFSRLVVFFRFEREIGHHLIQTFAPSTLIVLLSWFGFWLDLDAIPGRVTLLVTCMLTLVTMFTGLKSDIPAVAYVKALDLWMAGCMIFVFAALGEFVVVKVLDLRYQVEMDSSNVPRCLAKKKSIFETNQFWDCDSYFEPSPRTKKTGSRYLLQNSWLDGETISRSRVNNSKKIDEYSRMVFPLLFFVFVGLYWPMILLKKRELIE